MNNQTEEQWLVDISESDVGTGVFVFSREDLGRFGYQSWHQEFSSKQRGLLSKAMREDITYPDCVGLGSADWIIGFKWVPQFVSSFTAVQAEADSCDKTYCVNRCAKYGCVCVDGECR
jgi:hypothetical protein